MAKKTRQAAAKEKREAPAPTQLLYKVIEISNVDEAALERALNEWVPQGWHFDGVQFAMRESSKRPSMAFVFFTRDDQVAESARGKDEALLHLRRIADIAPSDGPVLSAYERLVQLAEGDDE